MSLKEVIDSTTEEFVYFTISGENVNWEQNSNLPEDLSVPMVIAHLRTSKFYSRDLTSVIIGNCIQWKASYGACSDLIFHNIDSEIVKTIKEESIDLCSACSMIQNLFLRRFKSA